jgi:hypothetical protein
MLAGVRSCFLLSFLLAISVAVAFPVQAQIVQAPINGAPPSVTSIGFGGNFINGVRASVTSRGPNGYGNSWSVFGNCCANFFWPANPNPPLISGHHHRPKNDGAPLVGVIEPVYVPYAVPYAPEPDDDSLDDETGVASSPRTPYPPNKRARDRDTADKSMPGATLDPDEPADPVATQPSNVLVFKDGHQSDVINYAIVGDTLFDFDEGRTRKILLADLDLPATHKANDDRGVDFQIPATP